MSDPTENTRPTPGRPATGLAAWQATIGYIAAEHSPDAMLTLAAAPVAGGVGWKATASWGSMCEEVADLPTLPTALDALGRGVDRHHTLFRSLEAAARRPIGYAADQWLDADSQDILNRLIQTCQHSFRDDWRLVLLYQPVAAPDGRVQARLLARQHMIHVGGRSGSLADACRVLYRNAATSFRSATR